MPPIVRKLAMEPCGRVSCSGNAKVPDALRRGAADEVASAVELDP
jgi:hypothetical protein